MTTKIMILVWVICFTGMTRNVKADVEERELPVFTEISLRIPAKLYIEQGDVQKVTLEARSSTLEEIITEISDRALIIRFPVKKYLWKSEDPGKIIIHITIPEVTGLSLSGSGDIIGESAISTLIMDLNVSGSGNIKLDMLNADRVKTNISGSGNINFRGGKPASEFHGVIAGSGNIKAGDFEAQEVKVTIAGSGNCYIKSSGNITVKIAGSGNLIYSGNPNIDSTVAGSGSVREIR